MLSQVRNFSLPPVFEDEEKTRLARLLHWILLALFALNSLNVILLAFFAPETLVTAWLNGLLFICTALSFGLMRAGKVQAGGLVLCVSLWFLLSYYLALSGGITSPALGFFQLVIIIGGILLGESGAILSGVLCLLATFVSYWAVSAGWWISIEGPPSPARLFATHTTVLVSLTGLMGMSARNVRHALTRARQGEAKLAERNRELEDQIAARQRVEEAYHVLVENSAQGLIIVQENRFLFANPRMCQIVGYTLTEFLAIDDFTVLLHADNRDIVYENLRRHLAGEEAQARYELRALHKLGQIIWLEVYVSFITYLGQPAVQLSAIDITERKHAELSLQASEERFRRTFEDAPLGMALVGFDLRPVNVNIRLCEMLGYQPEELIALTFPEFTHPDDIAMDVQLAEQLFRGEIPRYRLEKRYVKKNGDLVWGQLTVSAVHDAEGRQLYALGMVEDISKRKQTEIALLESEEKFSSAFHSSPIPIAITSLKDNRIIDVNESCCKALEFERHEMIGHTALELRIWVDINEREAMLRLLDERGTIRSGEIHFRTKSGALTTGLASFEIIDLNGERCLLTSWLDITERIQAEQALRQSEERFYKAFHANPLAIILSTVDEGCLVDVNDSCVRMLGYSREELIDHTTIELHLLEDSAERVALLQMLREQGTVRQMQSEIGTKSGKKRPIFLSAEMIRIGEREYVLEMLEDISELKRAEAIEREQRLFAEALRDMAVDLNSTLDMETVLDQILTHVGHVVPYDAATILLIDGSEAFVVRSKGFAERGVEQVMMGLRFPVDPARISPQNTNEHPLPIIEDTETHRGWVDIPEMRWIRSVVSAPLRTGNETIGFLDLIYAAPSAFPANHAERLQAFAGQASIAIHNARLFEQLRRLTQQMVMVQEEERRRISRELHDEAGQSLIALKMSLEAMKQIAHINMEAVSTRLADAVQLTDSTMELIRLLAQNLRPAVLDTLGLHLALQSHCFDFARRTGLNVVYTGMNIASVPDAINTSLYRFVQEALTNAAKHSRATQIRVDLQYDAGLIRLSVEDNGQGFDLQAMLLSSKQGVGLIGMQERLRSVNGWLEITRAPVCGSRLLACVPWETES